MSERIEHDRLVTVLGWYLIACVAYQVAWLLPFGRLSIFAPRAGLYANPFLPSILTPTTVLVVDWLIIAWQFTVAVTGVRHRPILKAYIVSETVFLIGSLVFPVRMLITGRGVGCV